LTVLTEQQARYIDVAVAGPTRAITTAMTPSTLLTLSVISDSVGSVTVAHCAAQR